MPGHSYWQIVDSFICSVDGNEDCIGIITFVIYCNFWWWRKLSCPWVHMAKLYGDFQATTLRVACHLETFLFEVSMSLKLKTFCYIASADLSPHFIPMRHNNHYVKAVQVHESNEVYFRNFYPFFIDQEYSRTGHVYWLLHWWLCL